MPGEAYAESGVDVRKVSPFKEAMGRVAKKTATFPNRRGVQVVKGVVRPHGGTFYYQSIDRHFWCKTQEGPGNKGWIGDYIYETTGRKKSWADVLAYDTAMMAVNDCVAQGALPVVYTDEIVASSGEWFNNPHHRAAFARGTLDACRDAGMALIAGESAVDIHIVNPTPPVKCTALVSGCATGIVRPIRNFVTGEKISPGDCIFGVKSSGTHANGSTLLIEKIVGNKSKGIRGIPDGFATKLPSGATIGEAILTRTLCYVNLVEALLDQKVEIHGIMPGTGGGVAKLALAGKDTEPLQYKITHWPEVSETFQFLLRVLGIPLFDCLTTFNWNIGYYLLVPPREEESVPFIARTLGFEAFDLGVVKEGLRGVVFPGPSGNIFLPPPGE